MDGDARYEITDERFVALFPEGDRVAGRPLDDVVREALGRPARSSYEVVWWAPDGYPGVLRNPPLLDDGTPMPTRYWLIEPILVRLIGTLEAEGGVRRAEADVDAEALARAHARYGAERDVALGDEHVGPRPTGGVGGTRLGVKCLHTHYAHWLVGGDDPVGDWVHEQLLTRPQR